LLDSLSSRYYGVLHGLLTSLFPDYYLLARGYCPLSLGFCLEKSLKKYFFENIELVCTPK
jgi:hypothetical protein